MIYIFYGVSTGFVRQVCFCDDTDRPRALKVGESLSSVKDAAYGQWRDSTAVPLGVYPLQAYLNTITGMNPQFNRHIAVVGAQIVADICCIDPGCGDLQSFQQDYPGSIIIENYEADVTWTYNVLTQQLIAPINTIVKTIPGNL